MTRLALAQVATDTVWQELGQVGAANMAVEQRGVLVELLQRQAESLRSSLMSVGDERLRAQEQAFSALAVAYQTVLSPSETQPTDRLREAHGLARDAMATLATELGKIPTPWKPSACAKPDCQPTRHRAPLPAGTAGLSGRGLAGLRRGAGRDGEASLRNGRIKLLGSPCSRPWRGARVMRGQDWRLRNAAIGNW